MPGGGTLRPFVGGGAMVLALAGCTPDPAATQDRHPALFEYLGVETRLLDEDLVNFRVEMRGARGREDVAAYAECAAAQYTLIRGYGFARHVRTNVQEEAGLWHADAVYTVSPALPRGVQTIDAEVVVADCAEQGIPTV
nr:hypothetical protein [Nioella sediminis]